MPLSNMILKTLVKGVLDDNLSNTNICLLVK